MSLRHVVASVPSQDPRRIMLLCQTNAAVDAVSSPGLLSASLSGGSVCSATEGFLAETEALLGVATYLSSHRLQSLHALALQCAVCRILLLVARVSDLLD